MPPARLHDIRCLADVHPPILPFLAPRIFGESSFPTSRTFKNARIPSQITNGKISPSGCLKRRARAKRQVPSGTGIESAGIGSTNVIHRQFIARLLSSHSVLLSPPSRRIEIPASNSPNQRFVEIAAFTQTQARAYSASSRPLAEESIAESPEYLLRGYGSSVPTSEEFNIHRRRKIRLRKAFPSARQIKRMALHETRFTHTSPMGQKRRTRRAQKHQHHFGDRMDSARPRLRRCSQRTILFRYRKLPLFLKLIQNKKRNGRCKRLWTIAKHPVHVIKYQTRSFNDLYRSLHRRYVYIRRQIRNLRRRVSLVEQEQKYAIFRHYRGSDHDRLMKRGHYRSLMRRLLNLYRRKRVEVDFSHSTKPGANFVGQRHVLTRGFAALDLKIFADLRQSTYPLVIKHDPKCKHWASLLVRGCGIMNVKKMKDNWACLDETAHHHWHLLLLYLLDIAPDRALEFLRILAEDRSITMPEILADALEHLARVYVQYQGSTLPLLNSCHFVPTFCLIYETHLARLESVCSDDLLYNVGRLSSLEDLRIVWKLINGDRRSYMSLNTILQYAHMFSHHGESTDALLCLKEISSRTDKFHRLCQVEKYVRSFATVLRRGVGGGPNYHMTKPVVSELLAMGVTLNPILYNVILTNAVEAGDLETAFTVYGLLEKNGIHPNARTYCILLHGCMRSNNPLKYLSFADTCGKMAIHFESEVLATDYLYYVYDLLQSQDHNIEVISAEVLRAYSRFFLLAPLEPFGLTKDLVKDGYPSRLFEGDVAPEVFSNGEVCSLDPSKRTMTLIIILEIRKAAIRGNADVSRLVNYLRSLVRTKKWPVLGEVFKNIAFWNTLLHLYCEEGRFESASQLIKSMSEGDSDGIPQPDVFSWNMFIRAFFKANQVQAAERVYEVMRSRGIDPDKQTYTTMIMGYARAQNIEGLEKTLPLIEEEAIVSNEVIQSLMWVRNKKAVKLALTKAQQEREKRERKEAEAAKAEWQKRWGLPQFDTMLSPSFLPFPESAYPTPTVKPPTRFDRKGRPQRESDLRVEADIFDLDDGSDYL